MTEKERVVKAAQTIKAYCEKTDCADCPLSWTEKAKNIMFCELTNVYPLDWEVDDDKG